MRLDKGDLSLLKIQLRLLRLSKRVGNLSKSYSAMSSKDQPWYRTKRPIVLGPPWRELLPLKWLSTCATPACTPYHRITTNPTRSTLKYHESSDRIRWTYRATCSTALPPSPAPQLTKRSSSHTTKIFILKPKRRQLPPAKGRNERYPSCLSGPPIAE